MAGGACAGTAVDPTGLPSITGYSTWPNFSLDTDSPGHENSLRIIFFNDVAQTFPHPGHYPLGTVIVKEIHPKGGGSLQELDIMRKVGDGMTSYPTQDGWLFTVEKDGKETEYDYCYETCHKQASHDGAWFDYGN